MPIPPTDILPVGSWHRLPVLQLFRQDRLNGPADAQPNRLPRKDAPIKHIRRAVGGLDGCQFPELGDRDCGGPVDVEVRNYRSESERCGKTGIIDERIPRPLELFNLRVATSFRLAHGIVGVPLKQ